MTTTQPTPPVGHEPCEECGAPMDPQQRYCVNCAARRRNGANPSSRYFAAMSAKGRKPLVVPKKEKAAPAGRAAAVGFFALLPIAVALGVIVGRGGGSDGGDSEALLQALRAQEATTASTAATGATATATGAGGKAKAAKNAANGKPPKGADKSGGKVLAQTGNGVVHEVTGYEPTKQKEEEDTRMVEENPAQVGDTYIKAQQNLPDVIVVGGDGGPAPTNGAEP
ncbi:MAG TPA: hypothetical protein VFI03_06855 [Solirubrobacterales bacterium]|nr:hypothetical protein [Solirubrobacterales bacterium]